MTDKYTVANPAPPRIAPHLTTTTLEAELLDDETQWWQLDINGGTDSGTRADNFTIEQCRIGHGDLSHGQWQAAHLRDCVVSHTNLANIAFRRGSWQRVSVDTARGTGLALTDCTVKDVTFDRSRLDLSGFRFSRLRHVTFTNCRLTAADFTAAELSSVRFSDCDLSGTQWHEAKLHNVRIESSDVAGIAGVEALRGAVISAAELLPLTVALAGALGIEVEIDAGTSSQS